MIKLLLLSLFFAPVSVYTFNITDGQGNVTPLSNFQGKKILFVNTATNSPYISQCASLEQLYQTYKDSLVVVAFPSNSFGNEPGTDGSIDSMLTGQYGAQFLISQKISVSGVGQDSLFNWLGDQGQNGMTSAPAGADFFKFLIDGSGNLIGVFNNKVDPMDSVIQRAVMQ